MLSILKKKYSGEKLCKEKKCDFQREFIHLQKTQKGGNFIPTLKDVILIWARWRYNQKFVKYLQIRLKRVNKEYIYIAKELIKIIKNINDSFRI